MSRLGNAPVPVGAPVPAQPWVGVDLGRVEKPRIYKDQRCTAIPLWACRGAGAVGWGRYPLAAYNVWLKEVERQHARATGWHDAWARFPVVHPTAERLLADLEAAIGARPPGWWQALMPDGVAWRARMQRGRP